MLKNSSRFQTYYTYPYAHKNKINPRYLVKQWTAGVLQQLNPTAIGNGKKGITLLKGNFGEQIIYDKHDSE